MTVKKRKVVTNGCFDILHVGHIRLLKQAKEMGDELYVLINSDESVKRLKGDTRPINTLADRIEMLRAIKWVDYVIKFDEDTPSAMIKKIKPDILVKGGDYTLDTIVGADFVQSYGGKVVIIPTVTGYSTTGIIEKQEQFNYE